jgi:FtsH-binding integral membrane protein
MKIDVTRIVSAQIHTMRDNTTQKYSIGDLLLFCGFPLLVSGIGPYYGWKFNADVLNALLTAFSIFAGLLLNLLILVYTFSSQTEHPTALAKIRTALIKELHDNIAYSILVSIVIVVVTMTSVAYLKMHDTPQVVSFTNRWLTGIIIFLTLNFVLTLLMILKRIYIMLNQTIGKPFISKKSA